MQCGLTSALALAAALLGVTDALADTPPTLGPAAHPDSQTSAAPSDSAAGSAASSPGEAAAALAVAPVAAMLSGVQISEEQLVQLQQQVLLPAEDRALATWWGRVAGLGVCGWGS